MSDQHAGLSRAFTHIAQWAALWQRMYSVDMGPDAVQAANFVRAHKVWRHVCYPGGIVPGNDDSTGGMQRLSDPPNQIAAEQQGITYLG